MSTQAVHRVLLTGEQIDQISHALAQLAYEDGQAVKRAGINGDAQYGPRQVREARQRLLRYPSISAVLQASRYDPDHFVKLVEFERDFPLPPPAAASHTAAAHGDPSAVILSSAAGSAQPSDFPSTPDGEGCVEDLTETAA